MPKLRALKVDNDSTNKVDKINQLIKNKILPKWRSYRKEKISNMSSRSSVSS